MTIDIYADIACPWCYVGGARLEKALEQRPRLDVTRRWRPFQLQPALPPEGEDFRAVLEEKFGSWNRAQQMFERIREMGTTDGLSFDFEAIDVAPNTADAHRLVLWAQDQGEGPAMATTLFRAYFSEGKNVSAPEVLVDAVADVGLDADAAESLLAGDEYGDAVRERQQHAQRQGITGVPCYVFGRRHAVMGAQSVEALTEALDAASE
jgi:predicted DsbA family dithiol-disulfide isomerase